MKARKRYKNKTNKNKGRQWPTLKSAKFIGLICSRVTQQKNLVWNWTEVQWVGFRQLALWKAMTLKSPPWQWFSTTPMSRAMKSRNLICSFLVIVMLFSFSIGVLGPEVLWSQVHEPVSSILELVWKFFHKTNHWNVRWVVSGHENGFNRWDNIWFYI